MALTDTAIRKAKAKDAAYRLSDGGGLYLWITPTGGKLWRWKYRQDGGEKLMSFGKYPDVSLSLARERHTAARGLLATGTDPMAQRKAEKAAVENSFRNVASLGMEHWQDGKSPRHVDYVRRRMDADILPILGVRPIAEIQAPELVAMTKAIEKRGARDIAKRALETVGQVFRYAIAHGYAQRNPASEIRPSDILKGLERMGYKGRMTGHGFRGLASTILHERGYGHEHIELQLAPAPRNAVSAAYNNALYLEPPAKMMQDWADFLEQSQRGAKVLTVPGGCVLKCLCYVRDNYPGRLQSFDHSIRDFLVIRLHGFPWSCGSRLAQSRSRAACRSTHG